MKLRVLGNQGGFPGAGGACSSYLMTLDSGENIVLDMGNGSLANLQRYISIPQVDAIFLSHLHYDHCADALVLNYALKRYWEDGLLSDKIRLFLPKTPEAVYRDIVNEAYYDVTQIAHGGTAGVGGAVLTFYGMVHALEPYGVRIEEDGKVFAYTGDTCVHDGLAQLLEGADFALLEAGGEPGCPNSTKAHLLAEQAMEAAACAGVKRIVLTHYSPMRTEEEIVAELGRRAERTHIGAEYEI